VDSYASPTSSLLMACHGGTEARPHSVLWLYIKGVTAAPDRSDATVRRAGRCARNRSSGRAPPGTLADENPGSPLLFRQHATGVSSWPGRRTDARGPAGRVATGALTYLAGSAGPPMAAQHHSRAAPASRWPPHPAVGLVTRSIPREADRPCRRTRPNPTSGSTAVSPS